MDEFVGFSKDRFVEDTRSAGAAETGVSKVISLSESYGFHSFSETDQSHVFTFEGTEEDINKVMYEIRKDPDSCKEICAFTYSVEYGSETHHTKVTCVAGTVSRKP
ncbi:MAG: hypothetical protein ILO68_06560, partial [Clostridia bacterium]|nr:hypothetical protein [Clostridia bacterium]